MSNLPLPSYPVRFPRKEIAAAFLPEDGLPFRNAVIGITYPAPDYHIERARSSPVTVFEYVLEGEGRILLSGKWQTARAGDVYVLRAKEGHRYRSDPERPWKKIWINYVSDYLSPMLDAYRIESGIYRSENARAYFEELFDYTKRPATENAPYMISDLLHRIVHTIASGRVSDRSDASVIREALSASVYRRVQLDEVASRLHMSKSNLIRVFKKQYGVTPYEYLLTLKLSAAKLLLKDTKMTIREISDRVCISDEHYFSSLFARKVGMRPRDYRARTAEKSIAPPSPPAL